MAKMWEGRFQKELNHEVNDFNSSLHFDYRLAKCDIQGSIAHVHMLVAQGIIDQQDGEKIAQTLPLIYEDLENGKLLLDDSEDIHMFVEAELTRRIGDAGKKLHTARSRNDQVALDIRMYLKEEITEIKELTRKLIEVILVLARQNEETIMPGYTHLQRAQPITLAEHLLAYGFMFKRDLNRLDNTYFLMNQLPLGSCALAGTTYPINRKIVQRELGFRSVMENTMDGVSDRDFAMELLSDISIIMVHLSRFSEEIILWSTSEFKFVELDDAYSTGSSIMPQKKNPDVCELVRGKTGRVVGDLVGLMTTMKGLPLAYNKDMQEDKEALFDSIDTVKNCLKTFKGLLGTSKFKNEEMEKAARKGFMNATDLADYLVKKGVPFRDAYKISGTLVQYAILHSFTLEEIPLPVYQQYHPLFDMDLYDAINLRNATFRRTSEGASSVESVRQQIKILEEVV